MAIENKRLVASALTGSAADYYTVAANKRVTVTSITAAVTGATSRAVTVKLAGFQVMPAVAIDGHEVFGISIGHVLEATEKINAQQDAGTDVDLIISGVVEDV